MCSQPFDAINLPSLTLCPRCSALASAAELATYKAQQHARLDAIVAGRLEAIGLAKTERSATLGEVPVEIKKRLPTGAVRTLLSGERPSAGFGLVGSQGSGKTMTLASIVRAGVSEIVTSAIAGLDRIPYDGEEPWRWAGRVLWLSWPSVAAEMKTIVARDRGSAAVEERIERIIKIPLLVIDDIGRERMRGAYTEDYAVGQLDRIIDARAREERPILWTANATAGEMERFYGGAMVSRLLGMAPPITLPKLADLRLAAS